MGVKKDVKEHFLIFLQSLITADSFQTCHLMLILLGSNTAPPSNTGYMLNRKLRSSNVNGDTKCHK